MICSGSKQSGFTLIELAIVLVIIGLLAGGIMAGQSLLRGAELQTITTDYSRYKNAVGQFKDQYYALPGDFSEATTNWGTAASCPGTAAADGTCNGDGDFLIETNPGGGLGNESFRAWEHLKEAGFIEGDFSGTAGAGGATDHVFGENAPFSGVKPGGWGIGGYVDNTGAGDSAMFNYNYQNYLTLGADDGVFADGPFLTVEEAWNIDTKIDDGKPGMGKVHVYPVNACTVDDDNTDRDTDYELTNTASNQCALIFKMLD